MTTWPEMIAALEERGWTLIAIADAIDSTPSAVSEIKQGRSKQPRGMRAVRLHALYTENADPVPATSDDGHA